MNRREYFKMYREKYREELAENAERHYIEHRDRIQLKHRLYYLEHRDVINQRARDKRHEIKEQKLMEKNDIRVIYNKYIYYCNI